MTAEERFDRFLEARPDLAPEIANFRSIIISLMVYHADDQLKQLHKDLQQMMGGWSPTQEKSNAV